MKPLDQGPDGVLALRAGIGIPAWVGMIKQGTPASIPQHGCSHLENVYFLGGRILSRAGQAKVNSEPVDGCIEGLFDAGDTGAPDLTDRGGGRFFYFIAISAEVDHEGERILVRYDSWEDSIDEEPFPTEPVYEVHDLRIGSDGELYASGRVYTTPDPDVPGVFDTQAVVVRIEWGSPVVVFQLFTLPADEAEPGFGVEGPTDGRNVTRTTSWGMTGSFVEDPLVPGDFYAARKRGFTASFPLQNGAVYRTPGVLDDTPTFTVLPAAPDLAARLAVFNDTVYSCWGGISKTQGGCQTIRKRKVIHGCDSLTWVNLTVPASVVQPGFSFATFADPVEFQGQLWVPGIYQNAGGDRFFHLLAVGTDDEVEIKHVMEVGLGHPQSAPVSMLVYGGFLYYYYTDPTDTDPASLYTNSFLGRTNGTTFEDDVWDSTIDGVKYGVRRMVKSRGSLWAIASTGTDDGGAETDAFWILKSNQHHTDQWEVVRELKVEADPDADPPVLESTYEPIGDLATRDL